MKTARQLRHELRVAQAEIARLESLLARAEDPEQAARERRDVPAGHCEGLGDAACAICLSRRDDEQAARERLDYMDGVNHCILYLESHGHRNAARLLRLAYDIRLAEGKEPTT